MDPRYTRAEVDALLAAQRQRRALAVAAERRPPADALPSRRTYDDQQEQPPLGTVRTVYVEQTAGFRPQHPAEETTVYRRDLERAAELAALREQRIRDAQAQARVRRWNEHLAREGGGTAR